MAHLKPTLIDSKLIQTLASIDAREMIELRKFIHSPFFCSDEKVVLLFDLITAKHPVYEASKLRKIDLAKRLFPEIEVSEKDYIQLLLLRCTYLQRLIYEYFKYKAAQDHSIRQRWLLLYALKSRGLKKDLQRLSKKFAKQIEKMGPLGARSQLGRYLMADFEITNTKDRFVDRQAGLEASLYQLDQLYFVDKFKRFCLVMQLILSGRGSATYEEIFSKFNITESLELFETTEEKGLLTQIYAQLLYAFIHLKNADFEQVSHHYFKVKHLLKNLFKEINAGTLLENSTVKTEADLQDIYNLCITICNHLTRRFDLSFQVEMFNIYQAQLSYELLLENGYLPAAAYKNGVTLALRLGKLKEAKEIIELYRDQIEPTFREGVYLYNLAHLYLYKNELKEVHKLLMQAELPDPYYHVGVRTIRLKAYYVSFNPKQTSGYDEIYDDFMRERSNMLRYLKRAEKLPFIHKQSYKNFIKFITNLMKIKGGNPLDIPLLKQELATQNVFEKVWLLAEIQKIKRA